MKRQEFNNSECWHKMKSLSFVQCWLVTQIYSAACRGNWFIPSAQIIYKTWLATGNHLGQMNATNVEKWNAKNLLLTSHFSQQHIAAMKLQKLHLPNNSVSFFNKDDRQVFCKAAEHIKKKFWEGDVVVPDVITLLWALIPLSSSDYDTALETVILGMVLVFHQVKAQTCSLHSVPDYKCFCTDIFWPMLSHREKFNWHYPHSLNTFQVSCHYS